jgi:hypothetical protein
MEAQTVTLHLPGTLMRRALISANALQRSMEEVLTDILAVNLPDVDQAPPTMQTELARMSWLSTEQLWGIAREMMSNKEQKQLRQLSELNAQRPLTQQEEEELDALRQAYGRVTLRKARAYALLSLRGGRPLLANV